MSPRWCHALMMVQCFNDAFDGWTNVREDAIGRPCRCPMRLASRMGAWECFEPWQIALCLKHRRPLSLLALMAIAVWIRYREQPSSE